MNTRMIKGMLVACMLLIGCMVQAQTSANPIGKWDFSVPDAPYEYSKGKAEFKMQDNKMVVVMTINNNSGDPMEITKKDNAYVCQVSVDGFSMTINLKPDGDNLKGTISSNQFEIGITMTPEKK